MTDARSLAPQLPALKLLIDGQHVDPVEGGILPVVNRATGEKSCGVPSATAADVDKAVKAARRAFEPGQEELFGPVLSGLRFKESGWRRELSHHALEGYLQTKAVRTKLPSEI
jgi:hypothetical protein